MSGQSILGGDRSEADQRCSQSGTPGDRGAKTVTTRHGDVDSQVGKEDAMRDFMISLAVGCALLAGASIASAQAAQKSDQQPPRFEETVVVTAAPRSETVVKGESSDYFLTFSGPVRVPGVTLVAGTYLFRFPAGTGSGLIQVRDSKDSVVYSMFPTAQIQDDRRSLFSDGQVVFRREPGTPPTINEWYLPGRTTGYEFIYTR
jgi:hypothetical protein